MVNILEAKTHLSRLAEEIASGAQRDIIIDRNGKPVAKLIPIEQRRVTLGVLHGKYQIPLDIDVGNAEIASEFGAD